MKICMPSRKLTILCWSLQVLVASILLQTLYFKFTGAEESRFIFATLGLEPWGRIGTGCVELVAAAMLLHGRLAASGAALAMGVISGAIASHLTRLGIVVRDDGGLLFVLALVVFVASAAVLMLRRASLPMLGSRLALLVPRLPAVP